MKNLNGLYNAMKLVESACEEGEITIIGNGAMPTAQELLAKCVDFINKQYGCDILNQVITKQTAQPTPYEEDDDEWEDEEDLEEEEEKICIKENWYNTLWGCIEENAPYLTNDIIDDIVDECDTIVDSIQDRTIDEYDRGWYYEKIIEILDEYLTNCNGSTINNLAHKMLLDLENNFIS